MTIIKKGSSDDTRQRLIMAGLKLYGQKGYEATRTRELADLANANQAAIPYHFGGKEGLYLAVAEYIVQRAKDNLEVERALVRKEMQAANGDREEVARLLVRWVSALVERVMGSSDVTDRSRFLLREYSNPGAAFDVIYNGMIVHVHRLMCDMVGVLINVDPESEKAILYAQTIFSAVMGHIATRNVLFRRLGWDGFTPERLEQIKLVVLGIISGGLNLGDPKKLMEAS